MSFTSFSKEFGENMFTSVENKFITRYLPQADGDAVRVYLYGLYLCHCNVEVDAAATAKLLRIPYERFLEIFGFWEECDLVHILSRDPLYVEYLPVSAAVGRPKPLRPEKYAEFNRELLRLLSRAGKDFRPYEMQRILEFLENEPMEQQAFLLIAEYCIRKDGEKVSAAHILNKAKKLCAEHKFTYEQAEAELNDFHAHERTLTKLFNVLGIFRKPQEADEELLSGWLARGFDEGAILAAAEYAKKGSLPSLGVLLDELSERGALSQKQARESLAARQELAETVFAVARKLGVKVADPRAYIKEYAEKWSKTYSRESLVLAAGVGFKLGYGFEELDGMLSRLAAEGVTGEGMAQYCAARDKQLRLLHRIQGACGVVKKTESALDTVAGFMSGFSEALILEAAKRSAGASMPLSYMGKLLSEWKKAGVTQVSEIPERAFEKPQRDLRSEAVIAADKRAAREHHYAVLQQRAQAEADKKLAIARADGEFLAADSAIRREEIALAKAEVFSPEQAEDIRKSLETHRTARLAALSRLGLSEEDLKPRYACPLCSDTGFLPNGKPCKCYTFAD